MTEQKAIIRSLQSLYMIDQPVYPPLPKHLIWQCPLLLPKDLSDFAELDKRVRQAGGLWLQNHDLQPYNLLVIMHKSAWISYLFQKPQIPEQPAVSVGPIPRRLLRKGKPLPPYPLLFGEFLETIDYTSFVMHESSL